MDSFDYILVAIGVALIVIGLFLFIAGKRDSDIANQVEGFGIKLNVSNPSIILIVLGIGLVLVPKFMGNNANLVNLPPNNVNQQNTTNNQQQQPLPAQNQQQIEPQQQVQQQPQQQTQQQAPQQKTPNPQSQSTQTAFFPQGEWNITQYEENGIDLSDAISGLIRFSPSTSNQQSWYAEVEAIDMWGNYMNYYYQGTINAVPNGYTISTVDSNDPSFVRQPATNLIMQMDNAYSLHMEYFFNGSKVVIHFSQ